MCIQEEEFDDNMLIDMLINIAVPEKFEQMLEKRYKKKEKRK